MKNEEILEGVLKEFALLAAVPRPSKHEEAISDFLRQYLTDAGFSVVQDKHKNLVVDKPAVSGFENAPRIILQGHMDMVCVARKGVAYDPLKDPIRLKQEGDFLMAEGTSLGADDGMGVAMGIFLLKNLRCHGPLRLILTVGEEVDMNGAAGLDAKFLQDADYLVNCDSETYDAVTIGSAGSIQLEFIGKVEKEQAKGKFYRLTVRGLLGGHSGERIGDRRGNAIKILGRILAKFDGMGQLSLAAFEGGSARNVIPSSATALFSFSIPKEDMQKIIEDECEILKGLYTDGNKLVLDLEEAETPTHVWSEKTKRSLLDLILTLHTGVYSMGTVQGSVETSANIGVVQNNDEEILLEFFPRSSLEGKLDNFKASAEAIARLTGFDLKVGSKSPAWKENKKSHLLSVLQKAWQDIETHPLKAESLHVGLECGYFLAKNPALDVVSLGTTNLDIHSPNERVVLSTIPKVTRLVGNTIEQIAKEQRQ